MKKLLENVTRRRIVTIAGIVVLVIVAFLIGRAGS